MNSTQTLTITLQSSSLSPETPISYSASPYTYTDVYGPQYPQQQINNNAPSESSTGEVLPQTQSSQGYVVVLIIGTILIALVLIATIVIAARRLKR